jgi:hypothetical protein
MSTLHIFRNRFVFGRRQRAENDKKTEMHNNWMKEAEVGRTKLRKRKVFTVLRLQNMKVKWKFERRRDKRGLTLNCCLRNGMRIVDWIPTIQHKRKLWKVFSTYGGQDKYIQSFGEETWRDSLEVLGVDVRIILKCFWNKYGWRDWTGLM